MKLGVVFASLVVAVGCGDSSDDPTSASASASSAGSGAAGGEGAAGSGVSSSGVGGATTSSSGAGGDDGSPISMACAALGVGEAADFPAGEQSAFGEADLAWQTAFHHDDLHGLIHLMGKPANADTSWMHQVYTVATSSWEVISDGMWNNPGHVYGATAIDITTGDVFQWRGGMDSPGSDHYRRAGWWQQATGEWGYTTSDIFEGALVSHANGSAYHPALYGEGDGGLILDTQFTTMFWRKSNGAVQAISHEGDAYGAKEGVGVYWPARDAAFVGGTDGGELLKVTPNGGGLPAATPSGVPPIRLAGNSHEDGPGFGSLHVHPGNPDKLLIVETAGQRAWTSTDGVRWTAIGDHPFTRVPRVVSSLRNGYGCLWAVGREGDASFSTLWRPPP